MASIRGTVDDQAGEIFFYDGQTPMSVGPTISSDIRVVPFPLSAGHAPDYEPGVDYNVDSATGNITIPPGSQIKQGDTFFIWYDTGVSVGASSSTPVANPASTVTINQNPIIPTAPSGSSGIVNQNDPIVPIKQDSNDIDTTYISDMIPNKHGFLTPFVTSSYNLYCPGETAVTTGNIINIAINKPDKLTSHSPLDLDEPISGRYLITGIRHNILISELGAKHNMILTVSRGTYSK